VKRLPTRQPGLSNANPTGGKNILQTTKPVSAHDPGRRVDIGKQMPSICLQSDRIGFLPDLKSRRETAVLTTDEKNITPTPIPPCRWAGVLLTYELLQN
jgi:hypothetical protein